MNILRRIAYTISFKKVPGQVMTKRSIDMKFVWIPAGEFVMGSSPKEKGHCSNEGPQRKVTISKGFWLGQTPVTQRQYVRIMGNNPSLFNKDHDEFTRLPQHQPFFDERPVEQVSWNDAIGFCQTLSRKMYEEYSLPTEAQWEYACRAGTTTAYCFGDNISQLEKYAWYLDNSNGTTKRVGYREPNAWNLYDMLGNVNEWCQDWYQDNYNGLDNVDPQGPSCGTSRVLRGGCFLSNAAGCRAAFRDCGTPEYIGPANTGFRIILK
jgi:formylglycine-generating enzyme required for sulfatase activity